VGEFDWDRPMPVSLLTACDIRYLLFYNRDGRGTPYGLVFQGRQKNTVGPHAGNPDGEGVFRMCSTNQEFVPRRAPVDHYNDTNVYVPLTESRVTTWTRWALFPELADGRGGAGETLLGSLRRATEDAHLVWWKGATRQPSVEFNLRWWPGRQPPPTLWR